MNVLEELIFDVLTEEKIMGYNLPTPRCLIRRNKNARNADEVYEIQLSPGGKWWRYSSEEECCEFAIGLGGAGGENYPIYSIRDDEIVHLVFPQEDLETYIQKSDREEAEKQKQRELKLKEHPEWRYKTASDKPS